MSEWVVDLRNDLDKTKDVAVDVWAAAKLAAIVGYSYLIYKSPLETLKFTWRLGFYVGSRAIMDLGMTLKMLGEHIKAVHKRPPTPPPVGAFIMLGVPIIVAMDQGAQALQDLLGVDDPISPETSVVV